jgi:hypothetical protein
LEKNGNIDYFDEKSENDENIDILMKSQKIMKILSIFIYYDEKGTVLIGKEWKY